MKFKAKMLLNLIFIQFKILINNKVRLTFLDSSALVWHLWFQTPSQDEVLFANFRPGAEVCKSVKRTSLLIKSINYNNISFQNILFWIVAENKSQ
jgi:hypothetical protein